MIRLDIPGQNKAVMLLGRALENEHLAHAYLFTGPDGVGKTAAARAVAAVIFCHEKTPAAPCGTCAGCMKFSSENHPDFLHIGPQGATIKIDQVRALKKALSFPPFESEYRVVLLEDAHTMRREAANSLLKLLEEPPPGNILLLSADESQPLLPTLVSRCQVIPFFPLPHALTTEIIRQQDPGMAAEDAALLAFLTGGCPGMAASFEAGELLAIRGEIITALLQRQKSPAREVEAALLLAAKTVELKEGLESLLNLLRYFFKETMLAHSTQTPGRTGSPELDMETDRARERWNLEELSDKIRAIDYAEQALARNCNKGLVCEVLFLRLLSSQQHEPSFLRS
jgi:DNA polymerase-3 subunit delta'